jgi:hypothetical protein
LQVNRFIYVKVQRNLTIGEVKTDIKEVIICWKIDKRSLKMKIFHSLIRKRKVPKWEEKRCPTCRSLLFEKDVNSYNLNSVRIKCRKCKEIISVV